MAMDISKVGLALIESFEGLRLTSYLDQNGIATVGYGHTAGVKLGESITQSVAETYLYEDLRTAVQAVNRLVKVALTQNQFDALCSFVFNVGQGNFASSTLLRDLNAHNIAGASAQFLVWDHVNGQPDPGLLRRREAEQKLFNT
jgi:lysozyme